MTNKTVENTAENNDSAAAQQPNIADAFGSLYSPADRVTGNGGRQAQNNKRTAPQPQAPKGGRYIQGPDGRTVWVRNAKPIATVATYAKNRKKGSKGEGNGPDEDGTALATRGRAVD